MELNLSTINWYAVLTCLVIGQIFLSVWFIVLFGKPWALEYGASDQKSHTKEIPGYTYGIQAFCTFLLIIGIASLQNALNIGTLGSGLIFGLFTAIFFSLSTAIPGYIFLKRWRAMWLAMGSQTVLIILISIILAIWK